MGSARAAFKQSVREQLKNKFVFSSEIKLSIILYLNEQKMLETPAYGDLDNYAKQLLDSMKGHGGLFIDDCQVQHLDISWIDIPDKAYFEIEINSLTDEFLPEPLKLYEMPDGLYYPISKQSWTQEGLVEKEEDEIHEIAKILKTLTNTKKTIRHQLRQKGSQQLEAYKLSKYVSPNVMGFHKSRVIDSGYELIDYKLWNDLIF
jgi:Holliday junction resolvase RusA-like endonuclease